MSFTNQTEHYGLPQWLGTDTPDWASDVNGAFTEIDTQMHLNAEQEAGNTSLIGALGTQVESLSGEVSDALEHITEDNALLKEIEAQHKINTQHIADLQEGLQEETGAREAGDTRLEGLITATNNTLEEVNQQVAGFQSGMEAAEAKIAQNKTDITALELKDGQHDTAITRAQETADTANTTAGQNASNISTLQTEVSENTGNIASLQADVTTLQSSVGNGFTASEKTILTHTDSASIYTIRLTKQLKIGFYIFRAIFNANSFSDGPGFEIVDKNDNLFPVGGVGFNTRAKATSFYFSFYLNGNIPANAKVLELSVVNGTSLIPNNQLKEIALFRLK